MSLSSTLMKSSRFSNSLSNTLTSDKSCKVLTWIFFIYFKALIDNQLLHSVLKDFISVFTEMYLDGVSGVPNLRLKLWGCCLFWIYYSVISI